MKQKYFSGDVDLEGQKIIYAQKTVKANLIDKIERGPGIKSFKFSTERVFEYKAGQYAFFEFVAKGTTFSKHFSISNSPTRPDIEITTIIRDSEYKQALDSLSEEDEIFIRGPFGNFTLESKKKNKICFLAGGIGITPMKSMLEYVVDSGLELDGTLFYSNRTFERMTFNKHLMEISEILPSFYVVNTLTDLTNKEKKKWEGETGYIDENMIIKHRPDYSECHYYISGPQAFNDAVKNVLISKLNIESTFITLESFWGY